MSEVAPLELLPSTVDREILRLSGLLETVTERLANAIVHAGQAETDWKVAEARSILQSSLGSEERRKAEAIDAHTPLYTAAVRAEAMKEGLTEKARSIRARLEALRTLAANLRSMA